MYYRLNEFLRWRDPLGISLVVAAVLHLLVIVSITFNPYDREVPLKDAPTLDITMVEPDAQPAPEAADYLANANREGGGDTAEQVKALAESVAQMQSASAPEQLAEPTPVLTRELADWDLQTPQEEQPQIKETHLTPAELIRRSIQLVNLNEQLNQSRQAYSSRPRQKFISARTREHKYASYMNDWVAKIERVGELNYPDEARRERLSGSLLLDVAINPDGSIQSIILRRPSGHKVLDDAAIRIARLAAPYAPLPREIRKETDVLHITRTWEFSATGRLYQH